MKPLLVMSVTGGLLALILDRHNPKVQTLIFTAISAFLTALTGLLFQLVLRDTVPVPVYFLRIVLAAGAGLLFPVALRRRTAVTDWLVGGVAVLALAVLVFVFWYFLVAVPAKHAEQSGTFVMVPGAEAPVRKGSVTGSLKTLEDTERKPWKA